MNKLRELFLEARSEIVGGLVVAAVLAGLSWISANSDLLSNIVIRVLNVQVSLRLILLIIGLLVGLILVFRGYRHHTSQVQFTSSDAVRSNPANPPPSMPTSGQAVQYHSCFISHSSEDQAFAERLNNDLKRNGVQSWFAPQDLKIGAKMRVTFDEKVLENNKLLLVLSEHSVNSAWIEQEVETALAKEQEDDELVLFPIRLDDAIMEIRTGWPALVKNTRHIGDFYQWTNPNKYQKALQRLLSDLQI